MNCKKAKNIDLFSYLKNHGFSPSKMNAREAWYKSPFRNEKTASFKVDLNKNIWYDFGVGNGGTIIDFVVKFNNCDVKKALEILNSNSFSFHQQQQIKNQQKNYSVLKVTQIENQNLINYLSERKINLQFAKHYCIQIHYSFYNQKEYYGIGFENDSGGFEIRNKFFKGCLGNKGITTINNNSKVLSIFESWSDFLSYLTLMPHNKNENFIITNSTSNVKSIINLLSKYSIVKSFFDNDKSGVNATELIKKNCNKQFFNESLKFKEHNDVNDYLKSYYNS